MNACIASGTSITHQRMFDDRVSKLQAVADSITSYALALTDQMQLGRLTRDEALERVRTAVHTMHFDGGTGYIAIRMRRTSSWHMGPMRRDGCASGHTPVA